MIGKHCYCLWSRAQEGIREDRAQAGVGRDYSISAITSFLTNSQNQQDRHHITHVRLYYRGSRPFSDIYIKGFPVSVCYMQFYHFITYRAEHSRVNGILMPVLSLWITRHEVRYNSITFYHISCPELGWLYSKNELQNPGTRFCKWLESLIAR